MEIDGRISSGSSVEHSFGIHWPTLDIVSPRECIAIIDKDGCILQCNSFFRRKISNICIDGSSKDSDIFSSNEAHMPPRARLIDDFIHMDDRQSFAKAIATEISKTGDYPRQLGISRTLVAPDGHFPVYKRFDWNILAVTSVGYQLLSGHCLTDIDVCSSSSSSSPLSIPEDTQLTIKRKETEELIDFFENAPMALHWLSASGRILWANKTEMELLGYHRDEYIGQSIRKFCVDRWALEEELSFLVSGVLRGLIDENSRQANTISSWNSSSRRFIMRLRTKTGVVLTMRSESNVCRDPEGAFRYIRSLGYDAEIEDQRSSPRPYPSPSTTTNDPHSGSSNSLERHVILEPSRRNMNGNFPIQPSPSPLPPAFSSSSSPTFNSHMNINPRSSDGSNPNTRMAESVDTENSGLGLVRAELSPSPLIDPMHVKIRGPPRLLIVDDSSICQKMLSSILTKVGCVSECVDNGRKAIELISKDPDGFDAVLMDIRMPVMNGIIATRIIREELMLQIPILALTAETESDIFINIMSAGANDYICKPARVHNIVETLKRLNVIV